MRHNWTPKTGEGTCPRCHATRTPDGDSWTYDTEDGRMPACAEREGAVRVYRYGARAPHEGADRVREQIWLAHQYRNVLTGLYREERERRASIQRAHSPELVSSEDALGCEPCDDHPDGLGLLGDLARARAEERRARQKRGDSARRRERTPLRDECAVTVRVPDADSKQRMKDLRAAIKDARATIRAERKALRDSAPYQSDLRALSAWLTQAIKDARAASGLRHGTYIAVEGAAQQAARTSRTPPRYVAWDRRGSDKIGTQLMGHVTWRDLTEGRSAHAQLRVEPRPGAQAGSRRAQQRMTGWLRLRVGSTEQRAPIWACLRCTVHRQPDPETRVRWVYVTRRQVAGQEQWSVQITLEGDLAPDCATEGMVAIDVGWRRMDDRLRVAVWAATDGSEGELALGDRWLSAMRTVESCASYRSTGLDDLRAALPEGLREEPDMLDTLRGVCYRRPEGQTLAECCARVAQWRSPGRFRRLLARWPEGVAVEWLDYLRAWLTRDRHVEEYQRHLHEQLVAQRKDLYRAFAARMAQRYGVVVTEALDLAKLKRVPPEWVAQNQQTDAYRAYMQRAAPGELLETVRARFGEALRTDPKQTTMRCHMCGDLSSEPSPQLVVHACRACGMAWDQDRNAARNLLATASGRVRDYPLGPLAPVPVETSDAGGPNRAERRAAETERSNRDAYPQPPHVVGG